MSLYYFHFRDGAIFEDDVGQIFANAHLAREHATIIASELAQGGERAGSAIIVSTDNEDDFEIAVPRWCH